MARGREGRMLNQNISRSIKVAMLSLQSKLLYTWLIPYGDDEGRLEGEPQHIKWTVTPQMNWSFDLISKLLLEIHNSELIIWYKDNLKYYIQIMDWDENQYIRSDRFRKSQFPIPPKWQPLTDDCQPLTAQYKLNKVKLNKVNITASFDFSKIWERYPKKLGKTKAEKSFIATVLTEKDYSDLSTALHNYCQYVKDNAIEDKYIKHGSTWFNCWRDWIDYKPKTQTAMPPIYKAQDHSDSVPMSKEVKEMVAQIGRKL